MESVRENMIQKFLNFDWEKL